MRILVRNAPSVRTLQLSARNPQSGLTLEASALSLCDEQAHRDAGRSGLESRRRKHELQNVALLAPLTHSPGLPPLPHRLWPNDRLLERIPRSC
jgi:hypothetical protein